jgi:hypothetical protein
LFPPVLLGDFAVSCDFDQRGIAFFSRKTGFLGNELFPNGYSSDAGRPSRGLGALVFGLGHERGLVSWRQSLILRALGGAERGDERTPSRRSVKSTCRERTGDAAAGLRTETELA